MIKHNAITDSALRAKIRQREVCFGGNEKAKIYGTLRCKAGKRMKRTHRVFFLSETEAIKNGYRPCGNCMKNKYQNWKNELI